MRELKYLRKQLSLQKWYGRDMNLLKTSNPVGIKSSNYYYSDISSFLRRKQPVFSLMYNKYNEKTNWFKSSKWVQHYQKKEWENTEPIDDLPTKKVIFRDVKTLFALIRVQAFASHRLMHRWKFIFAPKCVPYLRFKIPKPRTKLETLQNTASHFSEVKWTLRENWNS